ncbi:hypothetical protein SKAU_G00364920 [Synaphobranchus kaupii]|uniref:Uncharacterized protein n=1 Tax=Synaphobranchus kaupii TaxID=118154 RepID=A0A9Q1EEZ5_SYNKA|nr:hypothetical protein SKAU_G00364920 [Synaphobranchus kaupii]
MEGSAGQKQWRLLQAGQVQAFGTATCGRGRSARVLSPRPILFRRPNLDLLLTGFDIQQAKTPYHLDLLTLW